MLRGMKTHCMDQATYARMERAIEWLAAHYREQPDLETIAAASGLSPHHFQRLFTRWAGVSPKKFAGYLTLEHAKRSLAAADSVLDSAYDAGLSGPGRLHDLFVTHEAVTPGEWKAHGAGLTLRYGWQPSPFGACLMVATERGLCGMGFELPEGRAATEADLLDRWGAARLIADDAGVSEYASRAFGDAGTPLHLVLKGTSFQVKVWEALLRIPPGKVTSYRWLADSLGLPSGARAVAGAVAENPVSWLIPCHRVIRKTGAITGYRWGSHRKRAMLAWEAAEAGRASV
jgi:AraC family transcriptional regulator of adaptative response/methylated-DNA-[protein]-cysteine methyltransferase